MITLKEYVYMVNVLNCLDKSYYEKFPKLALIVEKCNLEIHDLIGGGIEDE